MRLLAEIERLRRMGLSLSAVAEQLEMNRMTVVNRMRGARFVQKETWEMVDMDTRLPFHELVGAGLVQAFPEDSVE